MADIFANHANNNRKEETENMERQTKREGCFFLIKVASLQVMIQNLFVYPNKTC